MIRKFDFLVVTEFCVQVWQFMKSSCRVYVITMWEAYGQADMPCLPSHCYAKKPQIPIQAQLVVHVSPKQGSVETSGFVPRYTSQCTPHSDICILAAGW